MADNSNDDTAPRLASQPSSSASKRTQLETVAKRAITAGTAAAIALSQTLHRTATSLAASPRARATLPILRWLPNYPKTSLPSDATAALVVAIMLVPQGMAYAILAGLPPQAGLYASVLPLILYAVFGTSHALAVGPVAIVSLMVASTLTPLAAAGSPAYQALALTLALLSGLFLILLGLLRAGLVTNFLSHPVLAGFTTAAALVIAVSQLRDLLGIKLASGSFFPGQIWGVLSGLSGANVITALIGAISVFALLHREGVTSMIQRHINLPPSIASQLTRAMPLLLVVVFTALTWLLGLAGWAQVATVGSVPWGAPSFTLPNLSPSVIGNLIVPAILISLVGFLESVAVGKTMASKRRESIEPDRELVGLGAANLGAAFTGGFPVTGGLSRSLVNFSAGATSQLAAILTAVFVLLSTLLLTPLLFHLPKAVLAAIVITAVINLIDVTTFRHAWSYSKLDGTAYLTTFAAVLLLGVDVGIISGITVSLLLHLWRTSKPHIAIVGRVGNTEHFRNVLRHPVDTYDNLLLMRIDESLYFANAAHLEEKVLEYVARDPKVEHFVLICSAVNLIDASALDTLVNLRQRLRDMGITMHLAEVKGPVSDRLMRSHFLDDLKPGCLFLSTHEAVEALAPGQSRHRSTPVLHTDLRKFA